MERLSRKLVLLPIVCILSLHSLTLAHAQEGASFVSKMLDFKQPVSAEDIQSLLTSRKQMYESLLKSSSVEETTDAQVAWAIVQMSCGKMKESTQTLKAALEANPRNRWAQQVRIANSFWAKQEQDGVDQTIAFLADYTAAENADARQPLSGIFWERMGKFCGFAEIYVEPDAERSAQFSADLLGLEVCLTEAELGSFRSGRDLILKKQLELKQDNDKIHNKIVEESSDRDLKAAQAIEEASEKQRDLVEAASLREKESQERVVAMDQELRKVGAEIQALDVQINQLLRDKTQLLTNSANLSARVQGLGNTAQGVQLQVELQKVQGMLTNLDVSLSDAIIQRSNYQQYGTRLTAARDKLSADTTAMMQGLAMNRNELGKFEAVMTNKREQDHDKSLAVATRKQTVLEGRLRKYGSYERLSGRLLAEEKLSGSSDLGHWEP